VNPAQEDRSLALLLRALKLPSFVEHFEEVAAKGEREGWSFIQYLRALVDLETQDRQRRRVERLLKGSGLHPEKTLATLNQARLPTKVRRQLPALLDGSILERAENLLAFGLPGRGKTHLLSAIGHELVQKGYRVLFVPAYSLVQRLLLAKRELKLERELKRLDAYDAVILDDIGYIQQDREEMEVLFTFLAERYERRTVMITSNLVFSQWDRIFKDAMTTAAAIDRVVHHAIILELNGPSIREEEALEKNDRPQGKPGGAKPTTTTSEEPQPQPSS
jgi:DNA replication protein DnaC